jgi:hypothetical protein
MKKLSFLQSKKQTTQKNLLLSTEMNTEGFACAPAQSLLSCILHQSCRTLSIGAFIDAYCNGNLSVLIRQGNPTEKELQDAWNEILFEYSALVANGESNYILSLQRRMSLLNADIFYIENAITILRLRYEQDIVDELIAMGFIGDYKKPEQLKRVVALAKNYVIELSELQEEFDRINATATGKKQTEDDYNRTLVALSKYIGYRIDKELVKVDEFAAIFSLYISESKKQETDGQRNN